jgi:hypothetical protein
LEISAYALKTPQYSLILWVSPTTDRPDASLDREEIFPTMEEKDVISSRLSAGMDRPERIFPPSKRIAFIPSGQKTIAEMAN